MPDDDWTYLRVRFAKQVEIVKAFGKRVNATAIAIERGQDGTEQNTFPAASIVDTAPTAAAIYDSYGIPLQVATLGGVKYSLGVISLEPINIIGLGGVGRLNSSVLGCCPVDIRPEIPLDLEPLRETSAGAIRVTSDDEYRIYR